MKTITAIEVRSNFGSVMDAAQSEPILFKKAGRRAVVIMGVLEFERLTALEQAYLASTAMLVDSGIAQFDKNNSSFNDDQQ